MMGHTFKRFVLLLTGVAVLSTLAGWLYSRQSLFRIQKIEVETTDSSIQSELQEKLLDFAGRSMFGVRLSELEAAVMRTPDVSSVRIKRVWPDRIVLEPEMRTAVMFQFVDSKLWLLDKSGEQMRTLTRARGLPHFKNSTKSENESYSTKVAAWLSETMLGEDERTILSLSLLDEVSVLSSGDLRLNFYTLGLTVDLGSDHWPQRWRHVQHGVAALQNRGVHALHLDASLDKKIFVYRSAELHKSESGLNLKELVRRTRDVRPEVR